MILIRKPIAPVLCGILVGYIGGTKPGGWVSLACSVALLAIGWWTSTFPGKGEKTDEAARQYWRNLNEYSLSEMENALDDIDAILNKFGQKSTQGHGAGGKDGEQG